MSAARDWRLDGCSTCGALAGESCLEDCGTPSVARVAITTPEKLEEALRWIVTEEPGGHGPEISEVCASVPSRTRSGPMGMWHVLRERTRAGLLRFGVDLGARTDSDLEALAGQSDRYPEIARMSRAELERREALS